LSHQEFIFLQVNITSHGQVLLYGPVTKEDYGVKVQCMVRSVDNFTSFKSSYVHLKVTGMSHAV